MFVITQMYHIGICSCTLLQLQWALYLLECYKQLSLNNIYVFRYNNKLSLVHNIDIINPIIKDDNTPLGHSLIVHVHNLVLEYHKP